jgi:hypothetical protein
MRVSETRPDDGPRSTITNVVRRALHMAELFDTETRRAKGVIGTRTRTCMARDQACRRRRATPDAWRRAGPPRIAQGCSRCQASPCQAISGAAGNRLAFRMQSQVFGPTPRKERVSWDRAEGQDDGECRQRRTPPLDFDPPGGVRQEDSARLL